MGYGVLRSEFCSFSFSGFVSSPSMFSLSVYLLLASSTCPQSSLTTLPRTTHIDSLSASLTQRSLCLLKERPVLAPQPKDALAAQLWQSKTPQHPDAAWLHVKLVWWRIQIRQEGGLRPS